MIVRLHNYLYLHDVLTNDLLKSLYKNLGFGVPNVELALVSNGSIDSFGKVEWLFLWLQNS